MKKFGIAGAGLAAVLLMAGGIWLLVQPAPAATLADCNVIIIVIDALRADHLGCYGYQRDTSPFIDSIAGRAVVFEDANSVSSYTLEVVPALLSGLLPSSGGAGTGWFATPPPDPNLGEMFGRAGYRTGFFTDHPALATVPVDRGFGETDFVQTEWGVSGAGPLVSQRALEFAKRNKRKKFMMYLHYLDPHGPYEPKKDSYLRFADHVYPDPLRLFDQVRFVLPELKAEGFGPGEARFEDLMLRYDAEIYQADRAVKQLFDGLKAQGLLDNTLVILAADHGEEFLDHGFVEHAWRLYRESVHVPLLFYAPKFIQPARVSDPVSLADVAPTVLDLAGVNHGRADFDGEALFQRQNGEWTFVPRTKPLIAELLLEIRNTVRTVIDDGYKYIAAQRWLSSDECAHQASVQADLIKALREGKIEGVDPWGPIVHEELYNLRDDPNELKPVQDQQKIMQMRKILDDYHSACRRKPGKVTPQQVVLPPKEEERRRKLGY